jgi:hypothetical protein
MGAIFSRGKGKGVENKQDEILAALGAEGEELNFGPGGKPFYVGMDINKQCLLKKVDQYPHSEMNGTHVENMLRQCSNLDGNMEEQLGEQIGEHMEERVEERVEEQMNTRASKVPVKAKKVEGFGSVVLNNQHKLLLLVVLMVVILYVLCVMQKQGKLNIDITNNNTLLVGVVSFIILYSVYYFYYNQQ